LPKQQKNTTTATTDAIIIGAGPAGLYAAFALGLQGLQSHIIDALPHIGGQCAQFFPDKTVHDIPGIQACTGLELAQRLLQQAEPFKPHFHLQKLVTDITSDNASTASLIPLFTVTLSDGSTLTARTVILASGTGAFLPKKLNLQESHYLEGRQLFYHPPASILKTSAFSGKHIVVSGDLESSLVTANLLAMQEEHRPASITLLHRRDKFRAGENTLAITQDLRNQGRLNFIAGQLEQLNLDKNKQLTSLSIKLSANQESVTQPADMLFILSGLSPQVSAFADWGLAVQGKQILVDTANFQTSVPGIFAIGDAITYPGKRQLIVSAFHEAALASYGVANYIQGGKPVPLLYTTSSSKLQEFLGKKHS